MVEITATDNLLKENEFNQLVEQSNQEYVKFADDIQNPLNWKFIARYLHQNNSEEFDTQEEEITGITDFSFNFAKLNNKVILDLHQILKHSCIDWIFATPDYLVVEAGNKEFFSLKIEDVSFNGSMSAEKEDITKAHISLIGEPGLLNK